MEGVPEALEIKWVAKDLVDVSESELSIQTDEGAAKGFSDRPYKKETEKDGCEEKDKLGKGMGHFIGSPAKARRREGKKKEEEFFVGRGKRRRGRIFFSSVSLRLRAFAGNYSFGDFYAEVRSVGIVFKSVDDSSDAVFEQRGVKVNKKTHFHVEKAKIGSELLGIRF